MARPGEKTIRLHKAHDMLKKGGIVPSHQHPHEQTGYLVSGNIRLTIGDDPFEVVPGDSWCIPSKIEHSVEIKEDAVMVEVFSPVREEYLPENLLK